MAQQNNAQPHYFTPHNSDGANNEIPMPIRHGRESSDSRQELLRLPIQPHPAHLESMEQTSSAIPTQNNHFGLTPRNSTSKKGGAYADPHEFSSPPPGRIYPSIEEGSQRPGRQSYYPSVYRSAYVEDNSDEEEDQEAQYQPPYRPRRRPTRSRRPPPSAYENYYESNSRYGPMPPSKRRRSTESHVAYMDHHHKPEYHMHYGSDDEYARRYPGAGGGAYGGGGGGGGVGGRRGFSHDSMPPESVMRLPWAIWMGSNAKNHFVAFIGEFVGTTMFLFFAFSGTQVANIGSAAPSSDNTTTGQAAGFSPTVLQYIALVFAFSLMVNVWVFFRISGGLFNPAVTFAMLLCRALSPIRAFLLLAAQLAGSIFASFLVSKLFPTKFNVRTTLGQNTSLAQGVLIEAVLTAELVFTIFMLAKEKHKATFIAPVGIGLALFIAELVGVYYTGGSLNPARSFGPCVVTGVFDKEHWIYWVGPAVGAVLAVVFYKFIKILEYEVANPGQDDDDKDQEVKEKTEGGADPLSSPPPPPPPHAPHSSFHQNQFLDLEAGNTPVRK